MARYLFALLAVLTGLAAISSTAHASLAEALNCDASISASASDDTSGEQTGVHAPPAAIRARHAQDSTDCRKQDADALRLPVLMGIDRAYE